MLLVLGSYSLMYGVSGVIRRYVFSTVLGWPCWDLANSVNENEWGAKVGIAALHPRANPVIP